MNEKPKLSKDKNKRMEEKEKLMAETDRSIAVAMAKQAHKLIEDTEKSRKRSSVLSICKRVEDLTMFAETVANTLFEFSGVFKLTWDSATGIYIRSLLKRYESVRFDLKKTIEIKDEDFERLFPKIEVNLESFGKAASSIDDISFQLSDMKVYCERWLH